MKARVVHDAEERMSEVGLEVRRRREAREWSQAKLAVEAGMAVSAVSQIETGKRAPSANSLGKLAGAFGVEIGDLFPKANAPLFTEPPSESTDGVGQRREYPYDWMAGALAELIDTWERQVDEPVSPTRSRAIAMCCHDVIDAITRAPDLVGVWGSGELSEGEFERVKPEFLASREEWWGVQDRLYEIARKGLEHYEQASKEAEAAGEVRELWELQERREEIRRRTRELSA